MATTTYKQSQTFPRFSDLPYEVRSKIWRFSITPRTVRFPVTYGFPSSDTWEHYLRGISDNLYTNESPPLLRVNKEARTELLLYKYRSLPHPYQDTHSLLETPHEATLWCEDDILYIDILTANDIYSNTTYTLRGIQHIAIYDDTTLLLSQTPLIRFLSLASLFTKAPHAKISLCLLDNPLSDPPDWYSPSNIQGSTALKQQLRLQCLEYYSTHISHMWLEVLEPTAARKLAIEEEEKRWRRDVKIVFLTDLRQEAIVAGQNRGPGVSADEARRAGIVEAFKNAVLWREEEEGGEHEELESRDEEDEEDAEDAEDEEVILVG